MKRILFNIIFLSFTVFLWGQIPTTNADIIWESGYTEIGGKYYLNNTLGGYSTDLEVIKVSPAQLANITAGYISAKDSLEIVLFEQDTVPITCLFWNYNDQDTLYFEMLVHTINSDSTENLPYRLASIAHYSTPTDARGYFSGIEITGTMTVVDGTSIQTAITSASTGDTIAIKSGSYTEAGTYLNLTNSVYLMGIGNVKYVNDNTSYAFLISSDDSEVSDIKFINSGAQYSFFVNNRSTNIHNCFFSGGSRVSIIATSIKNFIFSNNVIDYDVDASTSRAVEIRTKYFTVSENYFKDAFNASIYTLLQTDFIGYISYNKFDSNDLIHYSTAVSDSIFYIGNEFNTQLSILSHLSGNYVKNLFILRNSGNIGSITSMTSNNMGFVKIFGNKFNKYSSTTLLGLKNRNLIYQNNIDTIFTEGAFLGITSDSLINISILNNKFYTAIGNTLAGGFIIGDSLDTFDSIVSVIKYNYVEYSSGSNSHGFQTYNHGYSTMMYNYFVDVTLPCIFKGSSWNYKNSKMAYNVAKNGRYLIKGVDSALVHNNVSYIESGFDSPNLWIMPNFDSSSHGVRAYNNIFVNLNTSLTYAPIYIEDAGSSLTSNNNIIYSSSNKIGGIVTTYYNLSEWQGLGYDQNSINADPLFNNPSSGDYTLQNGSPAINTGYYLGTEYSTLLRPTASIPDNVLTITLEDGDIEIGAYAFLIQSGLSTSLARIGFLINL